MDAQENNQDKGQSLFDHLKELRIRLLWAVAVLIIGTVIAFQFANDIFDILIGPLANAMGAESTQRLIYTSLTEGFVTQIKLAFFTSLYITLPFVIFQIWRFVAPGLYRQEKKSFRPLLIATPLLFYLGGLVVYFFVMPLAWEFFLSFQTTSGQTELPIQLEAKISEYLNLILSFLFAFGICFQLPVLLSLLGKARLIHRDQLKSFRRYAILSAFVAAAFLTPPDILSQITLAAAILILYEGSIWLVPQQKKPQDKSHE